MSLTRGEQITGSVALATTASYALSYRNFYGSFYDTGSLTATSATAIYSMSLSTTTLSNGVYISGSSDPYNTFVKFNNTGIYNIQFSIQLSNSNASSGEDVWIWLRKNDVSPIHDLTDSAGVITVPPRKGSGGNGQVVAGWNYVIDVAAGDFLQLLWHVDNANYVSLETLPTGSNPTHPRSPSLILTATQVG